MGRPARADIASTRHVGFRLTQDEEARFDQLVSTQGHKDRSTLLHAWLAQGGTSTPRTNSTSSPSTTTSTTRTNHRQTTHVEPLLPRLMRELLPHASLDALVTLAKHGTIELRPDAGTEFSKPEDLALCPRGPRDTVFMFARWTDLAR